MPGSSRTWGVRIAQSCVPTSSEGTERICSLRTRTGWSPAFPHCSTGHCSWTTERHANTPATLPCWWPFVWGSPEGIISLPELGFPPHRIVGPDSTRGVGRGSRKTIWHHLATSRRDISEMTAVDHRLRHRNRSQIRTRSNHTLRRKPFRNGRCREALPGQHREAVEGFCTEGPQVPGTHSRDK